ncbi:hypothetical protein [Brevibacillus borstelensis]|uniref:hypothetical protein n=1 Tax=Brevibacillus borstelensis TaxID=45462 RepID=UPI0030C3F523
MLLFIRKWVPIIVCLLLAACANSPVSMDEIKKLSFQVFLPEILPDGFTEQKRVLDLTEESLFISYMNHDKYMELLQVKKPKYDYHPMIEWYANKDNRKKSDDRFEIVGNYVVGIDDSSNKQGVLEAVFLPKQDLDNQASYNELRYYHLQTNSNEEADWKTFIENLSPVN